MTTTININNSHIGPIILILSIAIITCQDAQGRLLENGPTCPRVCKCSWTVTNCTMKQLSGLPYEINSEVVVLDLSYNDFTAIPANISTFKILERLVLKHNRISVIGRLEKLENLIEVDLSNNRIIYTSDILFLFRSAINLTWLDLSGNSLALDIFSSNSLKTLKLNNCSLQFIPNNFLDNLQNLQVLEATDNSLQTIPKFVSNQLKHLDFSNCNIQSVNHSALLTLSQLQILKLSQNNKLKSFVANSQSLETLDLSNCNLESIPNGVMQNLNQLELHGNHIRTIDNNVFLNISGIKTINLSSNSIKFVHQNAFRPLRELFRLDLSHNILTSLDPHTFIRNKQLHALLLSRNYLSELHRFISKSITKLDLSECEIINVDAKCLMDLPNLVLLNLSRNLITNIPEHISSKSLSILDVSYCRIKSIRNNTFINLPKLYDLNLRGNRLIEIRSSYLHDIASVQLSDNTWHCDCKSSHFKQLFFHLRDIDSDIYELTCQSPESLEGLLWFDACRSWFNLYTGNNDRVWKFSIIIILVFLLAYLLIRLINRTRTQRRRALDGTETETPNIVVAGTEESSEESQPMNAPDPRDREDRPPSYVEALTFPPLGSCTSLDSRKSNNDRNEHNSRRRNNNNNSKNTKPRKRRKRRRSKSSASAAATSQGECDDESSNQTGDEIYKETEV